MTPWLVVLGMGLVTYLTRLSAILLLERASLPPPVARALRFIPPAVLLALVAPELARPAGVLMLSVGNPRLLAGAVAAVVARARGASWRRRLRGWRRSGPWKRSCAGPRERSHALVSTVRSVLAAHQA